jgi:hypothetical protein
MSASNCGGLVPKELEFPSPHNYIYPYKIEIQSASENFNFLKLF